MKTMALIVRRPDHTRKAFRDHYEEQHAPLAMKTVMEGATRYVRHHISSELYGQPIFDVVTAFQYRDAAAAGETMKRLQEEVGQRIIADEKSFMDREKNNFFGVTESPVLGSEDRGAGSLLLALVKAPPGDDVPDFLAHYEEEEVPAFLSATEGPVWCLQNRAVAFGPKSPAFDAVTQVHARSASGAAQWAASLEARGGSAILLAVTEEETETPWN